MKSLRHFVAPLCLNISLSANQFTLQLKHSLHIIYNSSPIPFSIHPLEHLSMSLFHHFHYVIKSKEQSIIRMVKNICILKFVYNLLSHVSAVIHIRRIQHINFVYRVIRIKEMFSLTLRRKRDGIRR